MDKGYFMLRVTNINRATKNIVASASYRSDEALYSERTDEKIKFRNHTVKPEDSVYGMKSIKSKRIMRKRKTLD